MKKSTLSDNCFNRFFSHSSTAFILLDSEFKVKGWNTSAEELLGYKEEETLEKDLRTILYPDGTSFNENEIEYLLNNQQTVYQCESKRKCSNGDLIDVAIEAIATRDENQKVVEILISFRDIREEKDIKDRIYSSSNLARLGMISAGIAHEIKNPLTVIMGKSEILNRKLKKGGVESEAAIREIEKINTNAKRISKILSSISMFSRNDQQVAFELNRLKDIIDVSVDLSLGKLKKHSVSLTISEDIDDIFIQCKEIQIIQVLVNLIGNAVDAISELDQKWIKIDVVEKDNKVSLSVTDSGNGISKEIQEKIMTTFFTTKAPGQGTGLGLSLSKQIIGEHKGRFYYDPNKDNTTFTFTLWKRLKKDKPVILIVDDDPQLLEVLSDEIGFLGMETLTAKNALEAIEMTKENQID
ncbi:MAG: ATP-binding protein, partial [Bacteriovoracaceae bacterium]